MLFADHPSFADAHPARVSALMSAADAAARAIPPAFPLQATVAVNPFLGQTSADLATAAARLERVAGARMTRPRADFAAALQAGTIGDADLAAALAASNAPGKPAGPAALKHWLQGADPDPHPLPTIADLAAAHQGPAKATDWPGLIARAFGLWAAGHFDCGQALWTPAPGQSAFAAWRAWASHDLSPEIAGLTGFCAHVVNAPDTAQRAILRAADRLGLTDAAAETAFHRLLADLGGWAQHARWLQWQAELQGGQDGTITDLLAIRLIWEEALLGLATGHSHRSGPAPFPGLAEAWAATLATHATPVLPSADHVAASLWQDAAERAHQRRLSALLTGGKAPGGRPVLQAAFCIDVRSEVFRRALEAQATGIETIGFAGFFGLPLSHRAHGTDQAQAHLPVLLRPAVTSSSHAEAAVEQATRINARAVRAWGRFRQAAVSSFAFVEAAGPVYGWKLVKDALALAPKGLPPDLPPHLDTPMTAEAKAAAAAAVLTAMSLTKGHARLVLLLGHGAQVTNNPHASAYHCGACGGQTGEVSVRLLADLLNDPETRAGLPALGITLPADTAFIAGLHDTTTDAVTLYPDRPAPDHAADLDMARRWLAQAGSGARNERAQRLPGARGETLARRAANWAELRPEWGLAGCAAFVAAPRAATKAADLNGRAFLHSYDWKDDRGFATLDLILTAPVVVASWISLQYYGSAVAPDVFGGGNKLIHNVVGGIGVLQGNGGTLRPGLPWQSVHDGAALVHDPLRLSVLIEAPAAAITDVLRRHDAVRRLFDNGWMHLLTLDQGRVAARYRPGLSWQPVHPLAAA